MSPFFTKRVKGENLVMPLVKGFLVGGPIVLPLDKGLQVGGPLVMPLVKGVASERAPSFAPG